MKIRVTVTFDLDPDQVRTLARAARETGHGHDGTTAPGRLIRRYLESKVTDAVIYCHDLAGLDTDDDR